MKVSLQCLTTSCGHRHHASRVVMQELVTRADEFGVDIGLEALPTDEEDDIAREDLVSFYARFGFVGEIEDESAWMSRSSAPSSRSTPA